MGRQERTSLPITWQALEITFLAFSWKLKCRRRGSGRDPSTLRFTGSVVGAAAARREASRGLGCGEEDALAGMQPWELAGAGEGRKQGGKARKGARQAQRVRWEPCLRRLCSARAP